MQKKLIAIVVAAALAPAAAMADTSNVTVYGKAHLSYDRVDNDAETGGFVSSNSSRIGFKGTEDLGDGLKAVWQYEAGVTMDQHATATAARDAFVGLAGGFGAVTVGVQAFHNLYAHDANLFSDRIGAPSVWIDRGGRKGNSIKYATPNMSGFDASFTYFTEGGVTYTEANQMTGGNDDDSFALKLNYSAGPLYVGVAYLDEDVAGTQEALKSTSIAARYSFGDAAVLGQFVRYEETNNKDNDVFTLGGSYKMGNGTLKAQYTTWADDADNADADMITVGYDYSLSKRTTVYALYSLADNDDHQNKSVTGSGHGLSTAVGTPGMGKESSAFSVGMVHDF
ncbi:MAG: hypothetical protein A3F73_03030 [Gallionellales bacterium RIFCSPLOWO2_12_FULL_59_22]|nr:MAG: hypothetical protein A2Z65_03160 [Gallionellales bacterium RIFCSPLOWO2_02_58_13]OGT13104.1 MAG: hypothetical protein A3F73_03030 [Gallionellales bacterium RIFCSPLOWO2_12_FULL_59_22]